MVIVAGWMEVDPKDRDAFVEFKREGALAYSSEKGFIDYVFTADPSEPGRVRVFELWESPADQDAHLRLAISNAAASPSPYSVLGQEITIYTVSDSRPWSRPK